MMDAIIFLHTRDFSGLELGIAVGVPQLPFVAGEDIPYEMDGEQIEGPLVTMARIWT